MNNDLNNELNETTEIAPESSPAESLAPQEMPVQEEISDIPATENKPENTTSYEDKKDDVNSEDDINVSEDEVSDTQPTDYTAEQYTTSETSQTPPQENNYYTPPAQGYYCPAPKKSKGANALLVTLWILVGLFALGFFGLCGYIIGKGSAPMSDTSSSTVPTFFPYEPNIPTTESTESEPEIPNKDETVPLPDKEEDMYSDKVSIKLNPFPEDYTDKEKYTTQYAYSAVSKSTIGVVCYKPGFTDKPVSQGTGIVVSADGYIATNSHVIGDSRSDYYVQVITNDGTIYEAKVIGYDSRTDLAVLKINATNLNPATFCDSEYVEVGQDVIAVGNPGGIEFQNSLTKGIVSAIERELELSSQVTYIQTDAAINPGNSGGPLCNMYGQVIGINTAKISSASYEGMGFAIPSATVKEIIDDLISQGYVNDRVRLGISGAPVSESMQQYYSVPAGILIATITEDGPCDGAGLQVNDILTEIDGEEVTSFSDIYAILAKHKPGDKVVLTVYKLEQDKTIEITVTLMADEGETQQ